MGVKIRILILCFMGLLHSSPPQSTAGTRVEIKAVGRSGEPVQKARVALLPLPESSIPRPRCVYPYCDRVIPGTYRMMVAAEGMLTVDRQIVISPFEHVVFAEMVPGIIFESDDTNPRGASIHLKLSEDQRAGCAVRLLGILSSVARATPVVSDTVEFPKLETGRYLVLLLRDGRVAACSSFWHDSAKTSRQELPSNAEGCRL